MEFELEKNILMYHTHTFPKIQIMPYNLWRIADEGKCWTEINKCENRDHSIYRLISKFSPDLIQKYLSLQYVEWYTYYDVKILNVAEIIGELCYDSFNGARMFKSFVQNFREMFDIRKIEYIQYRLVPNELVVTISRNGYEDEHRGGILNFEAYNYGFIKIKHDVWEFPLN